MKNLNQICKMLPFLFLVVMASCKKNKEINPDDPAKGKGILASELADYYLVTELNNNGKKLSVMHFVNEGGVTSANLHGLGYLRVNEVVVSQFGFSFDFDGVVYTYKLEKDGNGVIKLKSADKTGVNDIAFALLIKKSDSPKFENMSFKAGELLFKFKDPTLLDWDIQKRVIGNTIGPPPLYVVTPILATTPAQTLTYYSLYANGFKTNNDQIIGVSVPSWLGINSPVLLVEQAGQSVLKAVKQ